VCPSQIEQRVSFFFCQTTSCLYVIHFSICGEPLKFAKLYYCQCQSDRQKLMVSQQHHDFITRWHEDDASPNSNPNRGLTLNRDHLPPPPPPPSFVRSLCCNITNLAAKICLDIL